ncbi:MAG: molybdopterin-dependent oxidoreductase [Armatimonadetes bacterium]|nr:molybdopterin-dependent oxidoreductase [Armatimonadota bacterium]
MGKLSRRDFIKGSAAVLGAVSSAWEISNAATLKMGAGAVSRTSRRPRKGIVSTCLNCHARCGILGYERDGQLMTVGGNPNHPNNRGRMCAKGHAGINILYDPDRILHPMKRVGERGSGKWERIDWDQALDEVSRRMWNLAAAGRQDEFVFLSTRDITTQDFTRRFCHAYGSPNALVNVPLSGWNKGCAQTLTWGAPFEISDVANTQYMLLFGANPFEAHLLRTSFVQRITEGRVTKIEHDKVHRGAKMVTFDPRLSQTAGKSDEWIPIRPGTDGIVALAMANVIMREGLADLGFINKWCNYPADKLASYLKPFTPEEAERESGVSATDIRRIAIEFATTKPATTVSTGGISKHENGVQTERAVMLLNAITGNVDVRGGFCLPRRYQLSQPGPVPPVPNKPSPFFGHGLLGLEGEASFLSALDNGAPVDICMLYKANPCYEWPDTDRARELFADEKRVPFVVAIDSFMTETAEYADIILPDAMYLEKTELETPPSFSMVPIISLRQPVVPPAGTVRSMQEILLELARKVGGEMKNYFAFDNYRQYLEAQISGVDGLVRAGGLRYLEEKGVWFDSAKKPTYRSYEQQGFATPSRKFEIYSERIAKAGGSGLPAYKPIHKSAQLEDDEFILITYQWNVHTHGRTADAMWLSEIVHANPMLINQETGARLGLKTGDRVKVTSPTGELTIPVRLTEGIHPKTVAISDSCGHWAYGHVAQAESFKSKYPETEHIWWTKEGEGTHPNRLIAHKLDELGGGEAWMDTRVRIRKC